MGYLLLLLMFCCSYALPSALAMSSLPHSSSTVLERWISNIQIYTFYWLEFIFRETPALWCPGSFCLVSVWSWVWSVFSCFWSVSNWELLLEKSSVWFFQPTSSLLFGLTGSLTFFDQVKCAQIELCSMSEKPRRFLRNPPQKSIFFFFFRKQLLQNPSGSSNGPPGYQQRDEAQGYHPQLYQRPPHNQMYPQLSKPTAPPAYADCV